MEQCQFQFDGIRYTPPTRTFDDHLDVMVGDKPVHLIEVGPAHTRGDAVTTDVIELFSRMAELAGFRQPV
ncbi:MAG: hypothetical protein V7746_04465 [Halioglobus sp.]